VSLGEQGGPFSGGAAAPVRDELVAAGCSVLAEAAEIAGAEGTERVLTFHVSPKSSAALARALGILRARRLQIRVRGASDTVEPPRPGSALLDLSALDRIGAVDERGALVRAEAGCSIAALEVTVRRAGFTLGPLLPSVRGGSLGAWLAGPTRGERGIPGSRRETAAVALGFVLPDGRALETRCVPRSASGPDLDHLVLGGGGRLGVLFAAWIRLLPAMEALALRCAAASLPSAVGALEMLCLVRLAPARARVLLEAPDRASLAMAWEGPLTARMERARAQRLLRDGFGAAELGGGALQWLRSPAAPHAIEVDARWGSLRAWAQRHQDLPGSELQLVGLHAGGAFGVLMPAGADADSCATSARVCRARVLSPRRLRDAGPGWPEQGAGAIWARLVEELDAWEVVP
jgi:FAD/FMN-containing dehydrogenase